jgi:hypothetical protein
MSDLEPTLHAPTFEDPSVTRLLLRRADGSRATQLLHRAGAVATSVSAVINGAQSGSETAVDSLGAWRPQHARVELLVIDGERDAGRSALRDHLARCGRSWRSVARPPGGLPAALAAAAVAAEHEFVVVGSGGRPHYDLVDPALSLMWAEGADVALIHAGPDDTPVPSDADDPSATLSAWLGLRGPVPDGRLVLMRRWVARWLFNEITRAISPAEEVADRTRLLGIGIVEVATFSADDPLGRS